MNDAGNALRSGVKLPGDPSDSRTATVEEQNVSVKLMVMLGSSGICHGMQNKTVCVKKWFHEWASRNRNSSILSKVSRFILSRESEVWSIYFH
jgi:hypothetical protein